MIRDYHNFTLENALRDAENIITTQRVLNSSTEVEFITGYGVIRIELMNLLRAYKLSPSYKLGNEGVIVCVVE